MLDMVIVTLVLLVAGAAIVLADRRDVTRIAIAAMIYAILTLITIA